MRLLIEIQALPSPLKSYCLCWVNEEISIPLSLIYHSNGCLPFPVFRLFLVTFPLFWQALLFFFFVFFLTLFVWIINLFSLLSSLLFSPFLSDRPSNSNFDMVIITSTHSNTHTLVGKLFGCPSPPTCTYYISPWPLGRNNLLLFFTKMATSFSHWINVIRDA